jgi:dolichyl-phosphate-mannose-protein mannosyltransferase
MSERNSHLPALWMRHGLIIGVALLLRLAWAACVPADPVSDGILYDAFARSIVAGHGYAFADGTMTEYWPVGTSAAYALLYLIFGVRSWVVPVFQAFLGSYIVYLTWRLAHRTLNARVAAVAAWLTALWPLLIEFTTTYASELLFIALVLTSLNIWLSRRIRFNVRMILWGASIAAATYVRPTALPILVILPAIQWTIDENWRTLGKGLSIAGLTAALLFAPWSLRSLELFDRVVLVSANGGVNLWMGNNPASTGGYMALPARQFPNEVDRDKYYGGEAVKFILAHPLEYGRLSIRRAVTTYSRETIGVVWNQKALGSEYSDTTLNIIKEISSAYWWIVFIAGLAGIALALRRRLFVQCWPLLAALAYLAAFPVLTVAIDRYHVPIDPLLAIFAAYAICTVKDRPDAGGTSE